MNYKFSKYTNRDIFRKRNYKNGNNKILKALKYKIRVKNKVKNQKLNIYKISSHIPFKVLRYFM